MFIYFYFSFFCVSCSDNDKHDIEKNIQVEVFYKLEYLQQEYPDAGAKVFIYYDRSSIDFSLTTYTEEGSFIKEDGTVIILDQTGITDDSGITIVTPKYHDRMLTIVIESGFYSPQLKHEVYPSVKGSFIVKKIFEVEKDL